MAPGARTEKGARARRRGHARPRGARGKGGAHGKEGRARTWVCARGARTALGAHVARGARTEKGAHTGKGRAREGGAVWGRRARPCGAYARTSNGGRGPCHVGGVGAYARARQWGANRGRARLQGGAYICFALLIGICQAFSSWLLA
jgi:hypothetical protein